MTSKHVAFLIILILVAGLIGAGVNQFSAGNKETISPTPTPDTGLFGKPSPVVQNTQNAQVTQTVQLTPKTIKQFPSFPGVLGPSELKSKTATIETNKGNIVLEIYPEASKSASNFIFLARHDFYSGLTFHRVEPGFVIQGGDPLGNGTGGPGYEFEDEPVTKPYSRGIVAMANHGPNTNGSQFFIMLSDTPLPPKYTIFGKVILGLEVVDKIQIGDVMRRVIINTAASSTPTP